MKLDDDSIDTLMDMLDADPINDGDYEKRKSTRKPIDIRVFFMKESSGSVIEDKLKNAPTSSFIDISTLGVRLKTSQVFYAGTNILCKAVSPNMNFIAELKVVHFKRAEANEFLYGCKFLKITRS